MISEAKRAREYSVRWTRSLVRKALPPEVRPSDLVLEALMGGHEHLVRSLPSWVRRFGFLASPGHYCLWCDPVPAPGCTFASQMIIDIPQGRYIVDTFDPIAMTWVSRESAVGGPLVAGLPHTGNPVLAWIRVAKP